MSPTEMQTIAHEGQCYACGAEFEREIPPINGGLGDMRFFYCDECLAVKFAERDQFYAECREKNEAVCAAEGHWPLFPRGKQCGRCGYNPVCEENGHDWKWGGYDIPWGRYRYCGVCGRMA